MKPPQYVRPDPIEPGLLTGRIDIPQISDAEDTAVAGWQEDPKPLAETVPSSGDRPILSETAYISQVQQKIEAQKQYPKRAQRRNHQGVVKLVFTIGNEGEIVSAHIEKSSGSRILDQAAMEALEKAAPFSRPPKGPMMIQLPIRFQLL